VKDGINDTTEKYKTIVVFTTVVAVTASGLFQPRQTTNVGVFLQQCSKQQQRRNLDTENRNKLEPTTKKRNRGTETGQYQQQTKSNKAEQHQTTTKQQNIGTSSNNVKTASNNVKTASNNDKTATLQHQWGW
jgi:FtsZ-interacting cell division protein ZipA